jgi:hypothetical protein
MAVPKADFDAIVVDVTLPGDGPIAALEFFDGTYSHLVTLPRSALPNLLQQVAYALGVPPPPIPQA